MQFDAARMRTGARGLLLWPRRTQFIEQLQQSLQAPSGHAAKLPAMELTDWLIELLEESEARLGDARPDDAAI
jgi:hypothetical protein